MSITPFTIYIFGIADGAKDALIIAAFFSIIAAGGVAIFCSMERIRNVYSKPAALISAACALLAALIPSSKTIAMMVVIPALINSEPIQKDLPELYAIAKEALKETIKGNK